MEIFDVFSMNGIENYPAAGEFFLKNVILKVSDTLSQGFIFQGGGQCPPLGFSKGGHKFFKGGQCPPLGGAVKYPGIGTPDPVDRTGPDRIPDQDIDFF